MKRSGGSTSSGSSLPERYKHGDWWQPFRSAVDAALTERVTILDVGSGRRPVIPVPERPQGCTYVGLDLSQAEFDRAPPGSYHRTVVADITHPQHELSETFDLVVSWQVLEHVKPLAEAIENIRLYLRPGGRFVGQLSGTFSLFGLANRAIPHRVAVWGMQHLLGRDPSSVFPAHYDKCWYSALQTIGAPWSTFHVLPRYAGARYFAFSPMLQRLYLTYEEWSIRSGRKDLATHYLLVGER